MTPRTLAAGGTADRSAGRALPRSGLLDDAAYAAARAAGAASAAVSSLRQDCRPAGGERGRRRAAADAVAALRAAAPTPTSPPPAPLPAAAVSAPIDGCRVERARELGAFARAGFSRRVAEAVLACADDDGGRAAGRGAD